MPNIPPPTAADRARDAAFDYRVADVGDFTSACWIRRAVAAEAQRDHMRRWLQGMLKDDRKGRGEITYDQFAYERREEEFREACRKALGPVAAEAALAESVPVKHSDKLRYWLQAFVDYYTQAGIGECAEGADDDADDQFDGDERFNVRNGRAALASYDKQAKAARWQTAESVPLAEALAAINSIMEHGNGTAWEVCHSESERLRQLAARRKGT